MGKKVTFTLSAETVGDATSALLLGEFNNWNSDDAIILKKQKDGSFKATTTLEAGKTYQYRYLLSDGRWVNDHRADEYVPVSGYHVDNCVIAVPVEEVKEAAPKAEKAPKAKKVKAEKAVATADDLTKIEGIGKKIAGLLEAENILTFKDLSKASAKKLKGILEVAGTKFQMHDPTSWPKQAKLAAAEKWEELETLQKELVAGK